MPLERGTRLGPYQITSALGAGGMGEVYEARDTRLDRVVAIKVLPPHVAADPQFRERFEHEARTISQLDHPHICALYDVGVEHDISFLVMQYLEGETLADRLTRGSLPLDDALRYGMQIADALDAAHRAGIVHRDVKPGNIMITKSGAKLLDFGLARSGAPVLASSGFSMLPTTPVANLTAQGTILGTFQYMAPEQLEGEEADARTDIFALGTVLYEMLTGRKAFEGKSQATLIASIVGSEPAPLSAQLPLAPPLLDDVVRTCVAKDPNARWQSAGDLRRALQLTAKHREFSVPTPGKPSNRTARRRLIFGAVVVVAAALGAPVWFWFVRTPPEPAKISFDLTVESTSPNQFALTADGTRFVGITNTQNGTLLWVRRLDQTTPQTLAGTTGAQYPFWSPDGRFIGFFAGGKLNKIDIFGGPPQPLCDAQLGHGGTWNRDGVIVFAPSQNGPLQRVAAGGGIPTAVTELDRSRGDVAHRHPKFLPDGNHFIFFVASGKAENSGLYVGSLDSKDTRRIVASDGMGLFAAPNHLLFMRDTTLTAQEFDANALTLKGDPFPVAQDVGFNAANSVTGAAVSSNGMLALRPGVDSSRQLLRWFDRSGKALGEIAGVAPHDNVSLSPDGQRLVETRKDGQIGDLWMFDLVRQTSTRFTFDPAIDDNAVWSPDGNRVIFSAARDTSIRNLYVKSAGGAGQEELLLKTDHAKYPTDWSRDGKYLLYTEVGNSFDIWALPLFGDKKPIAFLTTPYGESRARFSPDGHWIAYTSDESGSNQIYVQTFPPSGGKWQISTAGGVEPHWRADGRELFYLQSAAVWSVGVSGDSTGFRAGTPQRLFDQVIATNSLATRYDVTGDGQRILATVPVNLAGPVAPIRVIVNWTSGLNQR